VAFVARRLIWDEYAGRWAVLHGGVDPRQASPVVRGWLRGSYALGRGLAALRIAPSVVTLAGLALSVAVPVVVLPGGGWPLLGAALVLLSSVADSADGAVALITARTTRLGAFYDAVADRLSEASWLVALWLLGAPGVLVTTCGALAWLHEYARARATAAGMPDIGVITVAERPTRVALVIVALVAAAVGAAVTPRLAAGAVTVVVAVWFSLGLVGAIRLAGAIRAALAHRES